MTRSSRLLLTGLVACLVLLQAFAWAQTAAPPAADAPPQVRTLLNLLGDPAVRDWLERQRADAAPTPVTQPATQGGLSGALARIEAHLASLVGAVPRIPAEAAHAGQQLMAELQDRGFLKVLLLIASFAALGFGLEALYLRATRRVRIRLEEARPASVAERLRTFGIRFTFALSVVAVFALGSVGAFLALQWPPLLREIVVGYLTAFVALRLTLMGARFLLAPGAPQLRIVPMNTTAAWFWFRRVGAFVGWFAFGWTTVALLGMLGFSPEVRLLASYAIGLVLLGIGIEIAWHRPRIAATVDGSAMPREPRVGRIMSATILTLYFVALWLFWVAGAMKLFWLAAILVLLPVTISVTQRSIDNILRPTDTPATSATEPRSILAVSLERGTRALLIIGAVLYLAWVWNIDLVEMTRGENVTTRLVRGALSAVVILHLADFAWQVVKALIDGKIMQAQKAPGEPNTDEARHSARLRTLLPILRNVAFAVLAVMAVMMVLSSLGIEIGPLIAGAGVAGLAIGFGAQTVVKDIISGMFYLLDDAFRVGEYIQSGSYTGTVESFSLRSVKLRHERGSIFIVPFGELGAVQNMSRDWVIDKFKINVPYDTDLDRVKKIIKGIGQALAEKPEYAPHIIEPLKMQGIGEFGDYAIQIKMKMMTKPNQQFVIRRRAFAMIQKAFKENGIEFAVPTVQVAGGEAQAVAARQALQLVQPKPTA
jgi:moderate conductance mechanosensitive channel